MNYNLNYYYTHREQILKRMKDKYNLEKQNPKYDVPIEDIENAYIEDGKYYINCKCGRTCLLMRYKYHKDTFNHRIYEKRKNNGG
jgi:hypothetical protein